MLGRTSRRCPLLWGGIVVSRDVWMFVDGRLVSTDSMYSMLSVTRLNLGTLTS